MNRVLKLMMVVCLTTLFLNVGCQRGDTNANANLTLTNANTSPIANANVIAEPISTIAAREPDRYRATLMFSAETEGGQKTIGIPTLTADVARNGVDRRVSFKLPDGSDLIYLEKGNLHIVVAPARKQYAELTPEATGLQLQKLMTPGQLVARLEKLKGIERVGEESLNGRTAEKYRYATTSNTNTQAGTVSTQAFVYVDRETGLPLRSELFTEASGEVQGMKGARIVAEMRNITTNVDSSIFEVPTGYSKVPPEQVRQQINALANTATALVRALFGGMVSQAGASPAVSPAATSPSQ
ncbi:MAG TPA: hypothetical protein VJ124_06860 [Pyrinomonadaceae bacterium]|nr:hypothetical protein [Pyrinomonadaceae bacterium]